MGTIAIWTPFASLASCFQIVSSFSKAAPTKNDRPTSTQFRFPQALKTSLPCLQTLHGAFCVLEATSFSVLLVLVLNCAPTKPLLCHSESQCGRRRSSSWKISVCVTSNPSLCSVVTARWVALAAVPYSWPGSLARVTRSKHCSELCGKWMGCKIFWIP